MAENAAHLSTSAQANPTVFEVVAQESLMTSLEASLKVLCEVMYSKNPSYLRWIVKWYDEIYLCLNWFLQEHYLKKCDGSFSEAFYNLRRIPLSGNSINSLTKGERLRSLFFLVALPYIEIKLKVYLDKLALESQTLDPEKKKLYDTVMSFYKYFSMTYESIKMIQYIRYMTGGSKTHSPLLVLAGLQLVYQLDDSKKFPNFGWKDVFMSLFRKSESIPDIKSVILKIFCQGLELGAFFIQFLKWWQTEDLKNKVAVVPVPQPPHKKVERNSLVARGLCPICQRRRRVEVALQTSGYVFCYKCIVEVLNTTGKCPVSGFPSTHHDLIRVYDSST